MRRPRYFLVLLMALLTILTLVPTAMAELRIEELPKVSVVIDGAKLDADAYIVEGRTVVPLRAIFERLSISIEWDAVTRTVTGVKGGTTIKLTIDQSEAFVGERVVTLAVPAMIINGRTFVPLRFIAEATGIPSENVTFDGATRTVNIRTNSGCTLPGFQSHTGKISPQGETWGLCGSPHIVKDDFMIEGPDSPVLTIDAGVLVQFESGAAFMVGRNAPGGLLINGKVGNLVTLTSAAAGAQPGAWEGIQFYKQTLKGSAAIQGASIQYAGGSGEYAGAIYVEGSGQVVEVQVKDTEIKNSLHAGIQLYSQGRLAAGSGNLKITGTKMASGQGGFPIITDVFGTHNLPRGVYEANDVNAVHIYHYEDTIGSNTTWRNIGIPYASSAYINVEGTASPTLTIEPGVITLWAQGTALVVGKGGPGYLVADATARPEGGGEWFTSNWKVEKAELDLGAKLATAASIEPQCGLCGENRAIVFGAWNASPDRGNWDGVWLYDKAGDKSKLVGVVIAYAGGDGEYDGGLYAEANSGGTLKFLLAKSLITGATGAGMQLYGANVQLRPESTGNYFTNNGFPIRMGAEHIGYLSAGQTFTGNDRQVISIGDNGVGDNVTKTATWRNHGIPYEFERYINIGGKTSPVVTIEAGTKLLFNKGTGIKVGFDGKGTLVAVGAAGKPIVFTSEAERKGAWTGLHFTSEAGNGNKLEYVTIDFAEWGVEIDDDLGGFIKNATIRSSSETGIYRGYDLDKGTSFLSGLGNQFEGNAADQNQ